MRILHLVHQYVPENVGGTELYTQTLAHYQARQLGHQVAVFYPSQQPASVPLSAQVDEHDVRVYAVPLGARSRSDVFLSSFREPAIEHAFEWVLHEEQPDVVHVQHLMGLPLGLLRHIKAAEIPFVVTVHDYWFPCANAQLVTNYDNRICEGPEWWVNCARCALARAQVGGQRWMAPALAPIFAYRSLRLRRWLAQADHVIAPTQFVRDTYAALDMPTHNLVVVPHGIEVPQQVLDATPEPIPHDPGRLHVVYVGSLAWQKGVHVLVNAVNQLPEGVHLSIYGDLDVFPDYVRALQDAAQHPNIRFHGRIDRDAFWQMLLHEADVGVLPTLWYEASPLTIQEMFAARVPLVVSNIGAMAEKVRDGVDGLLFPPGDEQALHDLLNRLYHQPALLQALRSQIHPTRLMRDHVLDIEAIYQGMHLKGESEYAKLA